MTARLVWAAPLLRGCRLVSVHDTVGGGAIARLHTRDHGPVHVLTDRIDGRLTVDAAGPGLGIVDDVIEDDAHVELTGSFGHIRFAAGAAIELLDLWSGEVDDTVDLATHPAAEQQLLASIVSRPDVQVRVSRRPVQGEPTEVLLSAHRGLAAATDASSTTATVFAERDLTMRVLDLAGLLAHATVAGVRPDRDHALGDMVAVQVAHAPDAEGRMTGGELQWIECGRSGWVQVLEGRTRRPVLVGDLVPELLSMLLGAGSSDS